MSRTFVALLALLLTFGYSAGAARAQERPADPPAVTDVIDEVLATLRRVEAEQRAEAAAWAAQRRLPVSARRANGERVQLVGLEAGRPVYLTALNQTAAQRTHTATLYPGQLLGLHLTGSGLEIGLWDSGVPLSTHQEFGGRVVVRDRVEADGHATHVAGTLAAAGVRPEARGMAYEATLRAFDWDNDATEMTAEAERGLLVSNHSYGVIAGWYYGNLENNGDQWYWLGDPSVSEAEDYVFGWYDVEAAQFDRVVFTNPFLLPVVAAGNDRGDDAPAEGSYRGLNRQGAWQTFDARSRPHERDGGADGFDTIAGAAVAKNVLTVGSIRFDLFERPTVSGFSSFGPTDDGRVKPDLVGYGERVFSTLAAGPTAYGFSSGTSMATPNVAGSLTLLQQHHRNLTGRPLRAASLKGLALHTARDLGADGPDYRHGWGLLDAEAAARQITDALQEPLALLEADLADGAAFTRHLSVAEAGPLRVTLSWTDPPSARLPVGPASLDNPKPHLRNDLDVRLFNDATGETYRPFTLDPALPSAAALPGDNRVDPVEQIYLPRAEAGSYTLVVSHKQDLASGAPQAFALLVSGAQSTTRPVAVSHLEAREQSVERVLLAWKTQFERSPGVFVVRRAPLSVRPDGAREAGVPMEAGVVEAGGASEQVRDYTFEERRLAAGRYLYRVFFESREATYLAAEVEVFVPAPERFAVLSNYPNPLRDRTRLVLDLPETQTVTLDVYDALGRRLLRVFSGRLAAGRHEVPVEAAGWPPGVYFARLATPIGVQSHRMVVVR